MSLIRDALERARVEAERQRAGGAPPPVRSYRRPATAPRGPWLIAAVSGLLGAGLAGGGLYLALARPSSPTGTTPRPAPSPPVVAVAPLEASPAAPIPPVVSTAPAGAPAVPPTTTVPRRAHPVPPAAAAPTPVATPRPTAPPPTAKPVAASPPAERVDAPSQATPPAPTVYAGEAKTPGGATMGLGGIAFSPSGPVALVNGKALGIGEGLVSAAGEAFVVEAIDRDRVTLVSAGVRLVIVLR